MRKMVLLSLCAIALGTMVWRLATGMTTVRAASLAGDEGLVRFQAHRGGLREVPENTLVAYRHAWELGGIPEVDICTTKDGAIICLHDATLARTTDAPEGVKDTPVSELTLAAIRAYDAGVRFDARFRGERVPELREVFAEMRGAPERQVYLDFKKLDLKQLSDLIAEFGVAKQIIFCHCEQKNCITLQGLAPEVRTMLWIGGKPEEIQAHFNEAAASGFKGLNQVQLHLNRIAKTKGDEGEAPIAYALPLSFVKEALAKTAAAGLDLEVLPFEFDADSLAGLLDLGVRWYATDEPQRFMACVKAWRDRTCSPAVYVRAHRGGAAEAPENTLAAFRRAWALENTIPELDVQTTRDGTLICLHDATLGRTTNAPAPINTTPVSELTFDEVRKWQTGAQAPVPSLDEVLALMRGNPDRQIYLDAKGADFERIKQALDTHGVLGQVIFCGDSRRGARAIQDARTFSSITGAPEEIKVAFAQLADSGFDHVTYLQIHLQTSQVTPSLEYALDEAFIKEALQRTAAAGVWLQLRPFRFDEVSLARLLDMGVRDFESDEPGRMRECIRAWQRQCAKNGGPVEGNAGPARR